MVSPTTYLPLLVAIDMFAVSLVIPLLHQYYLLAGIHSATQREFLSSVFSSSQILGGLSIGLLSDLQLLSRRNTLLLSFAGSAVSYGLICLGDDARTLVGSRVVVGFVKQTMTVSTALMAMHTSEDERVVYMGRLKASSTIAWIAGPSFGALLFKHVDKYAPAMAACALFVFNTLLAIVLIPKDDHGNNSPSPNPKKSSQSISSNIRQCFTSRSLGLVIASTLLFTWVTRATSYASMASYYEELYGIEPHQRGYLSSYQMCLRFLVQSALLRPLLAALGGERRAAVGAAMALAAATLVETNGSFWLFVGLLNPVISVMVSLLDSSLKTLVTKVAPKETLGSVLAALDVLQNAAAVTVPFYRAALFRVLDLVAKRVGLIDEHVLMEGDPHPKMWLSSSALHWMLVSMTLYFFLLYFNRSDSLSQKVDENGNTDNKKKIQ